MVARTVSLIVVIAIFMTGNNGVTSAVINNAVAVIEPNLYGVSGTIHFVKGVSCSVVVNGQLHGLRPNSSLGFHVHSVGNVTGGCGSTGVHWNPSNMAHGQPNSSLSHAGDLGNIQVDALGAANFSISNPTMSTFGLSALYGLAIVVHNVTDDLGRGNDSNSITNGNAGTRIACAIIGIANDTSQNDCATWKAANGNAGVATISGNTTGFVQFSTAGNCSVVISGQLTGLRPSSSLGFHVHELGDLTGSCGSAGLHWNPTNKTHGAPNNSQSHAGDLGNIRTDTSGTATFTITNPTMSSFGVSALYGRAIIVHNMTDDLGLGGNSMSLATGNAGARIACAVIGVAPPSGQQCSPLSSFGSVAWASSVAVVVSVLVAMVAPTSVW